jgi:hypothetical protein
MGSFNRSAGAVQWDGGARQQLVVDDHVDAG